MNQNRRHKTVIICFILLSMMMVFACSGNSQKTEILANDVGEKADKDLPDMKSVLRDELCCCLVLITGVSNGKTEKGYYDSDLSVYLQERNGSISYLYGSGKDAEPVLAEGISFDEENNRIILDGFQGKDVILYAEKMGSHLKLEVRGDCWLNSLQIYDGGLLIEGDGKLTVESTTREMGIWINSPRDYAYLIIRGNVIMDVGSTASSLINVSSKQEGQNFYYLHPLKMSDGKKRIKTPEVQEGAIWHVENTGETHYAPQSSPDENLIKLYEMDHVVISPGKDQ